MPEVKKDQSSATSQSKKQTSGQKDQAKEVSEEVNEERRAFNIRMGLDG